MTRVKVVGTLLMMARVVRDVGTLLLMTRVVRVVGTLLLMARVVRSRSNSPPDGQSC